MKILLNLLNNDTIHLIINNIISIVCIWWLFNNLALFIVPIFAMYFAMLEILAIERKYNQIDNLKEFLNNK